MMTSTNQRPVSSSRDHYQRPVPRSLEAPIRGRSLGHRVALEQSEVKESLSPIGGQYPGHVITLDQSKAPHYSGFSSKCLLLVSGRGGSKLLM